jgi:hypothetical protein
MSTPAAVVTAGNILAGPAAAYIGSLDASGAVIGVMAASAVNTTPPASAWADMGGTSGGVTLLAEQSMFIMRVDQIPDRVGVRQIERNVNIRMNLAEGTLVNMARALNVAESAITTGTGYREFALPFGQSAMFPTERAILMDGWAPVAANAPRRRRVLCRRVVSIENIEAGYTKDGLFLIPVTFGALYVNNTDSPVTFTDETA